MVQRRTGSGGLPSSAGVSPSSSPAGILYSSPSHLPRSSTLQRSEQKGRNGFCSQTTFFLHVGHLVSISQHRTVKKEPYKSPNRDPEVCSTLMGLRLIIYIMLTYVHTAATDPLFTTSPSPLNSIPTPGRRRDLPRAGPSRHSPGYPAYLHGCGSEGCGKTRCRSPSPLGSQGPRMTHGR